MNVDRMGAEGNKVNRLLTVRTVRTLAQSHNENDVCKGTIDKYRLEIPSNRS
jgi:hypothetical protein